MVESHEVAGKSSDIAENSYIASTDVIFSSTYHKKQQNAWPNSPGSHVVIYNWLYACQGKMEPFKDQPGHLWMSDKS